GAPPGAGDHTSGLMASTTGIARSRPYPRPPTGQRSGRPRDPDVPTAMAGRPGRGPGPPGDPPPRPGLGRGPARGPAGPGAPGRVGIGTEYGRIAGPVRSDSGASALAGGRKPFDGVCV